MITLLLARDPIGKQDDLLDGELIQQKIRADIILENYKSVESINKETAEFIATSGLRQFEPNRFARIIYTTNPIERMHRQIRKIIKLNETSS